MTKEIAIIDYKSPEIIRDLKKTVAQGATDEEFMMFAELCKSTGLNPFKREIWFIKTKGYTKKNGEEVDGKAQIMTGINGFQAIANSHDQYDGTEVIESDNKITIDSVSVEDWQGNVTVRKVIPAVVVPEYIEVRVWRKDRRFPATARAKWSEYGKEVISAKGKRTIWGQMPSIMLAKCAKSLALREAFPQEMNGLYTQEEMPAEFSQVVVEEVKPINPVLANLKTADEIQQATNKVLKDDDVSFAPQANSSVSKVYHYNLKNYFQNMEPAKANAITRKLEKMQGFDIGDDVWEVPQYIENLAIYLVSDELDNYDPQALQEVA